MLMQVIVDSLLANYQKTGSGPTVVALHGWGDSSRTFNQLARELADQYTVFALDLPGFGGTEPPPKAWGLEDYAKFVNAWLEKINAGHAYAVIGHSFGGSIAIVGVSTAQIESDKLVLLASGGVRNKDFLRKKALWLASKTLKAPLYILPSRSRAKIKNQLYRKIGSDLLLVPHMRQTFVKMVRQDVQQAARSIKKPTLLIYGSRDQNTPVSYGRLLAAAIPNAHLEIIPEVGHFPHHDQPAQVANLVKQFLGAK